MEICFSAGAVSALKQRAMSLAYDFIIFKSKTRMIVYVASEHKTCAMVFSFVVCFFFLCLLHSYTSVAGGQFLSAILNIKQSFSCYTSAELEEISPPLYPATCRWLSGLIENLVIYGQH